MANQISEIKIRKFGWSFSVSNGISSEVIESFKEMEEKAAGNRLKSELFDVQILDIQTTYLADSIPGGEIQTIVKFTSKSLDFAEKYLLQQLQAELVK